MGSTARLHAQTSAAHGSLARRQLWTHQQLARGAHLAAGSATHVLVVPNAPPACDGEASCQPGWVPFGVEVLS